MRASRNGAVAGRDSRTIPVFPQEARESRERVVLAAAPAGRRPHGRTEADLEELARLTDTAGGVVAGTMVQRTSAPQPRYYLGSGKARELAAMVEERDAGLVVFDDELTPAQGSNLETLLGVRVMDRAELILDIFATRARTYEARMQVELAQLQYLLPRLKRMWSHLSRIRGGIGLRGPGETQLETDRRLVGVRIAELRRKLKGVAQARATRRSGRKGWFRAALVGYTNAGKSSLLQGLSGKPQFVEDRLFATLDSSTRAVSLGEGREALLTDTVGFIRKLPHHLVASFRSTLEEAREADVLLHVVDSASPDLERHRRVVRAVLRDLDLDGRPRIPVFHKTDLLAPDALLALKRHAADNCAAPPVFTSALAPATFEPLRHALAGRIDARLEPVLVAVPAGDGETLAALHREAKVLRRDQEGETLTVVANAPPALVARLRSREGVVVSRAEPESGRKTRPSVPVGLTGQVNLD